MATGPRYRVPFRRRREGKTDYHRRLRLIKSRIPRLVVRSSLHYVTAQMIETKPVGDVTIVQASSRELASSGYSGSLSNTTAAYLVGLQVGKRAMDAGVSKAVLDIGLASASSGSRLFAVLKGAVDAGLDVPHESKVFPSVERIRGQHASREVGDIDSIIKKMGGPELAGASDKSAGNDTAKSGKPAKKKSSKKEQKSGKAAEDN